MPRFRRGAWRVGEYLDLVRLATITNETMDQSFFGAIGLAETTQAPAGQSSAARNPRAGSADTARSTQQNSYRLQSCPDSKLSIWVCQSCLQNRHCRAFFRSALSVFIRGKGFVFGRWFRVSADQGRRKGRSVQATSQ